MPYIPLYEILPSVAITETRVITLMSSENEFHLPSGEYGFVESFCDECDCRRAFFLVIKTGIAEPVAVITWGWESRNFYIKWFGSNEKDTIDQMIGCSLNWASKQSQIANQVLEMFKKMLLNDAAYISRVKRHYELFRKEILKK